MEDWEKDALLTKVVDHAIGIVAAVAVLLFVLRYAATQTGGRHYDAWSQAREDYRRNGAKGGAR